MFQLQTSIPEDTYREFFQGYKNFLRICLLATTPAHDGQQDRILAADAFAKCLKRNLDGKTVNQIVYLGSKLGDTSLSINDRIQLLN